MISLFKCFVLIPQEIHLSCNILHRLTVLCFIFMLTILTPFTLLLWQFRRGIKFLVRIHPIPMGWRINLLDWWNSFITKWRTQMGGYVDFTGVWKLGTVQIDHCNLYQLEAYKNLIRRSTRKYFTTFFLTHFQNDLLRRK